MKSLFKPSDIQKIILPIGDEREIPKIVLSFPIWKGVPIRDNYGGKPVVSFFGKPLFPEIAILRLLEKEGWRGIWVDTYRRKFRIDMPDWAEPIALARPQAKFLSRIIEKNHGLRGCWDIFAWKRGELLFIESKWLRKDRIRNSQTQWLQAALDIGLKEKNFLLIEWKFTTNEAGKRTNSHA